MPTALYRTSSNILERPLPADLRQTRSLAEAFTKVSSWRGEAVAVRAGQKAITYAALDQRANAVAHALQARGVARGSLVGIYLPRGIEMIVAMIAVCKAGAAYLPLDPTFPSTRVQETLSDARPAVLITDETLYFQLGDVGASVLLIPETPGAPSSATVKPQTEPDDLAYVIYTSGSTGRPKGVMVSQHNVLRLLTETAHWFDFNERDVWTMFHSFAFDFSVWEIWGCLLSGATLLIVPYDTTRSPEAFHALLSREHVTVLNQTPAAFGLLIRAVEKQDIPLCLRYVIFGGEALNLRSLHPWVQRFGDTHPQLVNMYGITETTVHVTYRRILSSDIERETESLIGEPIPDLQIHLLDENQQPVPMGEVGEMYIGGDGVALGYLGRPELTEERFFANPFSASFPPGRLYRSGDLARRRPDGDLVYLGRADRQVKINGFRVEPGEIEAVLAEYPSVQQVCVSPLQGADGTQFLSAYFTGKARIDHAALAASLVERLPAHMQPTFYVQLATFPLTVNGKVDREALPSPELLRNENAIHSDADSLVRQITKFWAAILQVESVSEQENFFDAGGTSLHLLALRTVLQQKLGRDVPVLLLFEHTTPHALAAKLAEEAPAATDKPVIVQTTAERQRQSFARARALRSMPS